MMNKKECLPIRIAITNTQKCINIIIKEKYKQVKKNNLDDNIEEKNTMLI